MVGKRLAPVGEWSSNLAGFTVIRVAGGGFGGCSGY
jgi:hypothetical protein